MFPGFPNVHYFSDTFRELLGKKTTTTTTQNRPSSIKLGLNPVDDVLVTPSWHFIAGSLYNIFLWESRRYPAISCGCFLPDGTLILHTQDQIKMGYFSIHCPPSHGNYLQGPAQDDEGGFRVKRRLHPDLQL